jgi:hypothetical protein
LIGAVLALSLFLLLVLLLASRWHKPVLFISYQNEHEVQADRLHRNFEALGHKVLKLEFDPARAHDPTVTAVRDMLARCDGAIAIPAETPSFMDTELARAETLGKGIVIARHLPEQRTIGAIQEGYPQIALHRLLAEPAAGSAFLCWVMFHWRTLLDPMRYGAQNAIKWFLIVLTYAGILALLSLIGAVLIGGVVYVLSGSGVVFVLMAGRWVELLTGVVIWPIAAFFFTWQTAVSSQAKVHGLVHQTFLSGAMTEKMLQDAVKGSAKMNEALTALIPQAVEPGQRM